MTEKSYKPRVSARAKARVEALARLERLSGVAYLNATMARDSSFAQGVKLFGNVSDIVSQALDHDLVDIPAVVLCAAMVQVQFGEPLLHATAEHDNAQVDLDYAMIAKIAAKLIEGINEAAALHKASLEAKSSPKH